MKDDRVSMHEKMDASMKAQGERISLADRKRLPFIVCVRMDPLVPVMRICILELANNCSRCIKSMHVSLAVF